MNEQGQLLQWENYRSTDPVHSGFSVNQATSALENGRGYLYRNYYDYTIVFEGNLNVSASVGCILSYSGTNQFQGFHLIGNPFPHDIYKNDVYQTSDEDKPAINDANLTVGYYELYREDGEEDRFVPVIGYNHPIKTGEGVLVQLDEQTISQHTMTITNTTNPAASYSQSKRGGSGNDNIRFEVSNSTTSDVAYAMFSEGHGLRKIEQLNEQTLMLYIKRNNEDYAIATLNDNVKVFNLSFEAKTTGYYTLSMKSDGEFDYIHLVDRLTGDDIDMLQEEEYTFIGSASDNADRFLVRLSPSTGPGTGSETFAWQNGNDIIVNGNGELQVFDVMGRMVATRHINGVQTINLTQTGVYIFRLEGKTQKIIVR